MTSEYYTQALVLAKEPTGESDSQVFLYTADLGLVIAKAVGARKIVSKLAGHLEPPNIIAVRLVQKNRFQIVDALKISALPKSNNWAPILDLVKELTAEGQPDPELWRMIEGKNLEGGEILRVLGFDRAFAVCQDCGAKTPDNFLLKRLEYVCSVCLAQSGSPAHFVLK